MSRGWWIATLLSGSLLVLTGSGCLVQPDASLWKNRRDASGDAGDAGDAASDASIPSGDADAACSTTGVIADCDPVALTGCSQGGCYLLPHGAGTACVCPPGTVTNGNDCETTIRCTPGSLCQGTAAPGTCRSVCELDASPGMCSSGLFCEAHGSYINYGYCMPSDGGPG
jgi:hypothetical protein